MKQETKAKKDPETIKMEIDKNELEARLKQAQDEIYELQKQVETLDKMMKDKERQTRQDRKQIDYLEGDKKLIKGEAKHFEELL